MKASLSSIVYDLAINGKINEPLSQEMMDCFRKLAGMANNLNQLARRVHETGRIYDADLEDISRRQEALWDGVHRILTQLAKLS